MLIAPSRIRGRRRFDAPTLVSLRRYCTRLMPVDLRRPPEPPFCSASREMAGAVLAVQIWALCAVVQRLLGHVLIVFPGGGVGAAV